MQVTEFFKSEVEVKVLKNEELCANAVNKINALLENGYKLVRAQHYSSEISSSLWFEKYTIEQN
jgi:hypothetical protein